MNMNKNGIEYFSFFIVQKYPINFYSWNKLFVKRKNFDFETLHWFIHESFNIESSVKIHIDYKTDSILLLLILLIKKNESMIPSTLLYPSENSRIIYKQKTITLFKRLK